MHAESGVETSGLAVSPQRHADAHCLGRPQCRLNSLCQGALPAFCLSAFLRESVVYAEHDNQLVVKAT